MELIISPPFLNSTATGSRSVKKHRSTAVVPGQRDHLNAFRGKFPIECLAVEARLPIALERPRYIKMQEFGAQA
jgi:hypothetical protein